MSSYETHFGIPYRIHPSRFAPVCKSLEYKALFLFVSGGLGMIFGIFWMILGLLIYIIGGRALSGIVLVASVGGFLPMLGSIVVVAFGTSLRTKAARLKDLAVLSHRHPLVTALSLAQNLAITPAMADKLLSVALQNNLISIELSPR